MDSNSSSSSDASYAGPMTRRRTKALAEGASKDVAGLIKEMLSQPALSQTSESIQEGPIAEEENMSPDDFEFSFSENIHISKLRDSPHFVSSFAMPIMMTNTTSVEEQVLTIAQTLEELMKSMKERKALRDAQITLLMDKMGNTSGINYDTIEETQVVASPSSKEEKPHFKAPRIDFPIVEKETKQTETSMEEKKYHTSKVTRVAFVLHYVPIAKRKEGQSPFSGDEETISKDLQGLNLPVTKITKPRSSSQP
nr:hypothetical protein CFP56_56645 [Quercus suber]POE98008.1 hypothetical protein CFP56_42492 [Quercus suber]